MAYLNFDTIFEFLGQFTIRCISFFKKVLIILRQSTKHTNFWLEMQYSLTGIWPNHQPLWKKYIRLNTFKGDLHLNQNWACFVDYLKNIYLKNDIRILIGEAVLKLLITTISACLVNNSRNAGLTKMLMPFWVSQTICFKIIILFCKIKC